MSKKTEYTIANLCLPPDVVKTYAEIARLAETDIETVLRVVIARDVVVAMKAVKK